MQETTAGHSAEVNRSCGPQPLKRHLHHGSWTYGSGNIEKEKAERVWEPEGQEVCCQIVSPRNICLNKTQRMEIAADILMWKRENLMGSHSWKKNYRKPMTAEGERISFFQGWVPWVLTNTKWPVLKHTQTHTHIPKTKPATCIYILYTFLFSPCLFFETESQIYVIIIIIKESKAINLRMKGTMYRLPTGNMGCSGGRRGKGRNYVITL